MRKPCYIKLLSALLLTIVVVGTAAGAYNLNFTLYNNSGWYFKRI